MLILNLGCGVNRERLYKEPFPGGTIHIDHNPDVNPDIVWDLNRGIPILAPDGQALWNNVDEIHAYHLIEHIGTMGDTKVWFKFWGDCWRALKPGGTMFVDAPYYQHEDAIGDPTHTRLISLQTFHFLSRQSYVTRQDGVGIAMSKLAIDFDLRVSDGIWLKKNAHDAIPCGIRVQLKAHKTAEGGFVPLENQMEVEK